MCVTTPEVPTTAVGVDGGDLWSGQRISSEELRSLVDLACSTTITKPIVAQYYPSRKWLWRKWEGTVLRRVLPKEVFFNLCFAAAVCLFFRAPGPHAVWRAGMVESLSGVARVWTISGSMVSFTLSFFLSQSYTMWRSVYSITRRVQGRLNDVGLLCATFAERNATGAYTPEAEDALRTVARYCRLFHMLFYASVSTRFAPLKTPQGLSALVNNGALTAEEREVLLESSLGHEAVIGWLSVLVDTSVAEGLLGTTVARARVTSSNPIAVQMSLQNKLTELRSTYASMPDELSGRMPLAYVQLVQILTDGLILTTPFALIHSVGPFGVVMGTAVVTLFHSSIVMLAKLFLDPLNNEVEKRGGDPGIGGIEVETLLQQTNLGSDRWRRSAGSVPEAAWRRPLPSPEQPAAVPAEVPGLIERIFRSAVEPVADPDEVILGGDESDTSGMSDDTSATTGSGDTDSSSSF